MPFALQQQTSWLQLRFQPRKVVFVMSHSNQMGKVLAKLRQICCLHQVC